MRRVKGNPRGLEVVAKKNRLLLTGGGVAAMLDGADLRGADMRGVTAAGADMEGARR